MKSLSGLSLGCAINSLHHLVKVIRTLTPKAFEEDRDSYWIHWVMYSSSCYHHHASLRHLEKAALKQKKNISRMNKFSQHHLLQEHMRMITNSSSNKLYNFLKSYHPSLFDTLPNISKFQAGDKMTKFDY